MTSAEFEKQDEQVIDLANRGAAPAADHVTAGKLPDNWAANLRKARIRAFFQVFVELGGYMGLGGVMLAALALGIVPLWASVPVFTGCFIWSAIRFDRFFREEW